MEDRKITVEPTTEEYEMGCELVCNMSTTQLVCALITTSIDPYFCNTSNFVDIGLSAILTREAQCRKDTVLH